MSAVAPPPWRWQVHDSVASTQDLAIAAARAGTTRLAVLAMQQTGGRGSRGRAWIAPAGNLNLSVAFRPNDAWPAPGYWAMLAGVCLFDALAHHTDGLMLKWPNDVLLHGAKLGGVLIDSSLRADGRLDWVVIGLGANLAEAPRIEARTTASLPPPPPAPRDVAAHVLENLDRFASANIRAEWLARAHPKGTEIDVVMGGCHIHGRFEGVTEAGELLLEGHARPIGTAEIFLTSPASSSAARPLASTPCC